MVCLVSQQRIVLESLKLSKHSLKILVQFEAESFHGCIQVSISVIPALHLQIELIEVGHFTENAHLP